MSNPYYDSTGYPQTGASGSSAAMRSEFDAIEAGFNKLPTLSSNGGKSVKVNAAGNALETSNVISDNGTDANITGDLVVAGGEIGQNAGEKHTIPQVVSDVFALLSAAQTLINKTIVAANNTITTAAVGNLTSTNLNAALAELQADIDTRATTTDLGTTNTNLANHLSDTVDAHDASAISNIPSGNLAATNVQDALNELQGDINSINPSTFALKSGDTFTGLVNLANGANIASAATVDLSSATGNTVHITGTTGIAAWTMTAGQVMNIIFDGILTLTHNATTNNLPGAANITTAANDRAVIYYDGATTYVFNYQRANGTSVVGVDPGTIIDYGGEYPPAGYLTCPISQTYIDATTYSNLAFAIGTKWGSGGSTTNAGSFVVGNTYVIKTVGTTDFTLIGASSNTIGVTFKATGVGVGTGVANNQIGLPWYPADYASVQANGNVGTQTVGQVIAHVHASAAGTGFLYNPGPSGIAGTTGVTAGATPNTASTGGTANLAAGSRVLKCIKY